MSKGRIKEQGSYRKLIRDESSEFYKMHQFWLVNFSLIISQFFLNINKMSIVFLSIIETLAYCTDEQKYNNRCDP